MPVTCILFYSVSYVPSKHKFSEQICLHAMCNLGLVLQCIPSPNGLEVNRPLTWNMDDVFLTYELFFAHN